MDFLLASVSQVFEATSVVWRWGVPRANVNRVQRRGEGDKKKWFRTIISVYTWRRSQKAVDTAQTLMWMCIHRKPRRKHTHTQKLNELCQHNCHVTSYCHTSLTSLYSLICLKYLYLFRNEKQVWWMKWQHHFPPCVSVTRPRSHAPPPPLPTDFRIPVVPKYPSRPVPTGSQDRIRFSNGYFEFYMF